MSTERLLDIARRAVGLTADDGQFLALVGPGETHARQVELARLSTCALFLRGCLATTITQMATAQAIADRVEPQPPRVVVPPRLWAPYQQGKAMADLVAVCGRVRGDAHLGAIGGAYQVGGDIGPDEALVMLSPGLIYIVGTAGHEHAILVERVERDGWPDGSSELITIEAGQTDDRGRQCVRRKRHEIDASGIDRVVAWADPQAARVRPLGERVPNLQQAPSLPRPIAWVLDPRGLWGRP